MNKACVLVFAGLDPSGGAGIQADIMAIAAHGAHALPIITTLTVQDNDRVFAIHPVDAALIREQARVLTAKIAISAVKIGIVGNRANAEAIAGIIRQLRIDNPGLPVVLDPVLASGHGDMLTRDDAVAALAPLRSLASLVTPNLPEATVLCGGVSNVQQQGAMLLKECPNVLIKGGHGEGEIVINHWFTQGGERCWSVPRLPGSFHGTGCTLASAIAALIASGSSMEQAIARAQVWCHSALERAYAIAEGQRIPERINAIEELA
ncbi:hydroxymethylpyrimidine/phosphomethylpyrimidine kinase [Lacisediminimonas sp.]|uniref:bifunctional hydroxymethylpyrimidine kinase/phosphomethylpyrimidine kinase n=1 Tax=Lacisediminimonas sp. TaxID=3060582 RepID=UPI0027251512|nr:hydroxymethylpyrimidine/phosphomethylpyrimidine kinase [Lacisediminimonas sp.]MDO8299706.1 hydroxymethylpyrimidine/phosphomethylpyrimidine kinase [Lacisediminimonas sp.]